MPSTRKRANRAATAARIRGSGSSNAFTAGFKTAYTGKTATAEYRARIRAGQSPQKSLIRTRQSAQFRGGLIGLGAAGRNLQKSGSQRTAAHLLIRAVPPTTGKGKNTTKNNLKGHKGSAGHTGKTGNRSASSKPGVRNKGKKTNYARGAHGYFAGSK